MVSSSYHSQLIILSAGSSAAPPTPPPSLTNLGAREYNPASTLFLSPDPVLTPTNPQDLNPYAYAQDNPATSADPTGLLRICYSNCNPAPSGGSGGGGGSSGSGGGDTGSTVPAGPPGAAALPPQARRAYDQFIAQNANPYYLGFLGTLSSLDTFCNNNEIFAAEC